jgi:hypothetical protein
MCMSTAAIVGIGTTITNAKSIVPKSNFFIVLPPTHFQELYTIWLSHFAIFMILLTYYLDLLFDCRRRCFYTFGLSVINTSACSLLK